MTIKQIFILILVCLGLCANTFVIASTDKSQAEAAIAAAEKARKKAGSVSGEWRDTAKLIKKAKGALKEGNYEKAMQLAKKAEHEGKMGYEQALAQQKLRLPAYLNY